MLTDLPIPKKIGEALAALPHKTFEEYGMDNSKFYAAIVLEKTGQHTLTLGEKFYTATPEQQAFILLHEYTHLAFGHPLKAAQLKLNPQLWNIATDAWINEVHPHHLTTGLGGILYEHVRKEIPNLPPWLIDPIAIYTLLKEKGDDIANDMDTMMVQELESPEAEGKAGLEMCKARQVLQQAAQECPELKPITDQFTQGREQYRTKYTDVKVAPWLETLYSQIERYARMKQGDLVRQRGWRRPGRHPSVPGSARRPSLHVAIALDVSGSTTEWWSDILAACRGIVLNHTVHIVCHSDEIVFDGEAIPDEAPVGGGTDFAPVVKRVNEIRPDILIWVTDGEASKVTLPDCPIAWVWLPHSSQWSLRQQDIEVQYEVLT